MQIFSAPRMGAITTGYDLVAKLPANSLVASLREREVFQAVRKTASPNPRHRAGLTRYAIAAGIIESSVQLTIVW